MQAIIAVIFLGILSAEHVFANDVLFADSFNAPLSAGWSWVREDPKSWRVSDRGLEVRVQPGNMWGNANNAKNVLVRPAPDPSKSGIEVSVTVENRPTEQYEQVNLVWYYDDSHMVKLGQELVDGQLSIVMGREAADRTRTIAIIPIKLDRVQLRFFVKDGEIRGEFRGTTDDEWKQAGKCDLPVHGEPKISLQTYQGPSRVERWVRFTQFEIRRIGD